MSPYHREKIKIPIRVYQQMSSLLEARRCNRRHDPFLHCGLVITNPGSGFQGFAPQPTLADNYFDVLKANCSAPLGWPETEADWPGQEEGQEEVVNEKS